MFCKNCGKEIPNGTKFCPECGANQESHNPSPEINESKKTVSNPPQKKKSKFKIGCLGIIGIIVLLFIIGIFAGGGDSSTKSSKPVEKTYKIGETYNAKNFEITILNKEIAKTIYDKTGYLKTDANGEFVVLTVKYKNISKESKRLDNSAFSLKLDDKTYSPSTLSINIEDNIFLNAINPGVEKTGKLYFDVPADIANSEGFTLEMTGNLVSNNGNGKIKLIN